MYDVTYWTGIWEPQREAISKEVSWLRGALAPRRPVVSFTPQPTALHVRERVLRLNFHRWYALRAAALVIERTGSVSHVFGGIGTTEHFLTLLGRRPVLFTVVLGGSPSPSAIYDRVSHFVVENRGLGKALAHAGIDRARIDTIYPAIDLRHFRPATVPSRPRFTLLFASTPADVAEIETRGIGLLIELARARRDIDVLVIWRQWGDVDGARRELESRAPPSNFLVEHRDVADMAALYHDVHATVCCFDASVGKSAPNSVVEGLAAGRPALLTDTCGIADLVAHWRAGVVTPRQVDALARGVDEIRRTYEAAARQARALAETEFDSVQALRRYAALYERLGARSRKS